MSTYSIGMTGSRDQPLNPRQVIELRRILRNALNYYGVIEFHHGDCVGADASGHKIALAMGARVIIRPPKEEKARAFCEGAFAIRRAQEYLTRNKRIVDVSDMIVAFPSSSVETLRSGTWSTVRYARRMNVPIELIPATP